MLESYMSKKTLVIIDSYALIFRAYYAFPPTLQTKDGELTNAAYGFTSLLLEVLKRFEPSNIVAIFDSETPIIRSTEFTQYKANRIETDPELIHQIPRVRDILETMDIPVLHINGFEADDIIATIVRSSKTKDIEKIVVTGDQDLFQLIQEDTKIFLAGRKFSESKIYDAEGVVAKLGITPEQVPEYKALCGDPSDNIPGVNGIGAKTAQKLISEYGNIDNLYRDIDNIKGAVQTKLINDHEMAYKSRDLATVVDNAPVMFELEKTVFRSIDAQKVITKFESLEFKSLVKKFKDYYEKTKPVDSLGLFDEQSIEEQEKEVVKHNTLNLETDIKGREIFIFGNYLSEDESPINLKIEELYIEIENKIYKLEIEQIEKFMSIVQKEKIKLISLNIKNFFHSVINLGVKLSDNLEFEDLGFATQITSYSLADHSKKSFRNFWDIDSDDTKIFLSRFRKVWEKIQENLSDEFLEIYNLEKAVLIPTISMEQQGITLEKTKLSEFEEALNKKRDKIKKEIYEEVGYEFNINSPKQVGEVLYDKRGLAVQKKTKGGASSTNERALKNLKPLDPVVGMILEYREIDKLINTYVSPLPSYIQSDGKVHASFDQMGAVSGRFSSKNPNMQNIPINENLKINVREAFVADSGKRFIAFDYSQQELRILAALAKEQTMIDGFNQDKDIHRVTAAEMFDKEESEVTDFERNVGKTINFSIVYGISAYGLAERMDIDQKTASEFIKKYYEKYPAIYQYFEETKAILSSKKYAVTIFGRKRQSDMLKSRLAYLRSAAERELLNFAIQGSAADIMKKVMPTVHKIAQKHNAKLLLQIHDEFLFEIDDSVKESTKKEFIEEVEAAMESVVDLGVKFKVDYKEGRDWGETK